MDYKHKMDYKYKMDNNNENEKDSSFNLMFTFGIGLASFSWAFYKFPIFRRDVIQAGFYTVDYIYDVYHKLRYDDKDYFFSFGIIFYYLIYIYLNYSGLLYKRYYLSLNLKIIKLK